ncbi:FTR1 family protein [Candidatus Gottesmanbacteria bacterium]|nr:FTR1 family protein [Candidatus Gottesmanbacteria bacterium]
MIAAFLITLREVIEASLIVATILGILIKLRQHRSVRAVWLATGLAALLSVVLLGIGSLFGIKIQEIYSGKTEEFIEGVFMVASAAFITWAVFFLHKYFASYKTRLIVKISETLKQEEQKGIFWLAFTAVFREGFEIVLFLSTIFFSSNPKDIFTGFAGGLTGGLLISAGLFAATIRLPVLLAFRATSLLLIFFAAGLFARGVHEFAEAGILPELTSITLHFLPAKTSIAGDMIKAIFGLTRSMDIAQLTVYTGYVAFMVWWVFVRKGKMAPSEVAE